MAQELFKVINREGSATTVVYVVSQGLKGVVEKHENALKIERVKEKLEVL
jgi:hypothetical protein